MNLKQFENIDYTTRSSCIVCETPVRDPIIELPRLPITGVFTDRILEKKIGLVDQNFHICDICGHGQVSNVLDQEVLYGSTYATRGSTSTAKDAVDVFLNFVKNNTEAEKYESIIDIGCNDFYMLQSVSHLSDNLYGIDPALKDINTEGRDINVIPSFVEEVDMSQFKGGMGLVLSSHTFEHIPDPKRVIQRLLDNADEDTVFAFQFPGLETLINDYRFDQIFHQHLNYFSLQSVICMLDNLGAELIRYEVNGSHWGALMVLFKKRKGASRRYFNDKRNDKASVVNKYIYFKNNMDMVSEYILNFKGSVCGYGASQMLPLVDYHIGDAFERVNFISDDDKNKEGMSYLNSLVGITAEDINLEESMALVTAISSMSNVRKILPKLIEAKASRIISPFNLI